jgi:hypothetical protein
VRLDQSALRGLSRFAALLALVCALPGIAGADRLPLIGSGAVAPLTGGSINHLTNFLIVPVDPDSVPCPQSATFNSLPGGENPGANYDDIIQSGGLYFAERFVGQTLSYNGDFDVISGIPTNPLSLQAGASGQNLNVLLYTTSNVLGGLGNLGYPDLDAIGEGSIAISFPTPQSRVSFEIVGGNGGSATLGFYGANGSLLDNVVVSGLAEIRYGFATADGERSIAGILIQSTDPSGIGVDNICHDGGVTSPHAATWGRLKTLYR